MSREIVECVVLIGPMCFDSYTAFAAVAAVPGLFLLALLLAAIFGGRDPA